MQVWLRPYATVGVAVVGAAMVAVTPVAAPAPGPRVIERAVELASTADSLDVVSALQAELGGFGRAMFGFQETLAWLIYPDLIGEAAKANDTTAAADLGQASVDLAGFDKSLGSTGIDTYIADGQYAQALGDLEKLDDAFGAPAQTETANAAATLSAGDKIHLFQVDLHDLLGANAHTVLPEMVATVEAAPAAVRERVAIAIDPEAARQVRPAVDAAQAAELAKSTQAEIEAAEKALNTSGTVDPQAATAAVDAAQKASGEALTYVNDAAKALPSTPVTAAVSDVSADALEAAKALPGYPTAIAELTAALDPATLSAQLTAALDPATVSAGVTAALGSLASDLAPLTATATTDAAALLSLLIP